MGLTPHAWALLLLPFSRELIDGPTPLHLIEKPTVGTGATLLAEALMYPAVGNRFATLLESGDDEEWRKRITAMLLGGATFAVIDNLTQYLRSAALAMAITTPNWEDRILGRSETMHLPVRVIWVATGNNPRLSHEIARRTVRIRLDAGADRPWLRKNFKHSNLREYLRQHRGELVWAALTIIQAWLNEGRPVPSVDPLGSFESWSRVMGGILEFAGIPGFLSNLDEFYENAAPDEKAWTLFIRIWWSSFGTNLVTTNHLCELVLQQQPAVALELGVTGDHASRVGLGKRLSAARDAQIEGMRITKVGTQQHATVWQLVPVQGAGV